MLNKLSRKDIELLNNLAQTPEGKSALEEYIKQHEKAVKAYKVYRESVVAEVEVPKVEKSANELRAEIIEKAKEFVKECRNRSMVVRVNSNGYAVDVSFIVNANKRTVVALMMGVSTGLVRSKGIAKCSPGDVFNADIGKAIALGRALGKDVSEFENAVQPTVAIGQEIEVLNNWTKQRMGKFLMVDGFRKCGSPTHDNGAYTSDYKITDDTNARY